MKITVKIIIKVAIKIIIKIDKKDMRRREGKGNE